MSTEVQPPPPPEGIARRIGHRLRRSADAAEVMLCRLLPPSVAFKPVDEFSPASTYDFDKAVGNAGDGIPRTVSLTWLDNSFGPRHRRSIRQFIARNPGFDFVLFDDGDIDDFMRREFADHPILPIYERAMIGPCKTDIFRYALLHRVGGFYFDIKSGAEVPLIELGDLDRPNAILGHEALRYSENVPDEVPEFEGPIALRYRRERFLQWAMGFSPGHPITARVLANIVRDYPKFRGVEFVDPKWEIIDFTGPRQFTRAVWAALEDDPDLPITEHGVDFDLRATYSMPGGSTRFVQLGTYKALRDQIIVG